MCPHEMHFWNASALVQTTGDPAVFDALPFPVAAAFCVQAHLTWARVVSPGGFAKLPRELQLPISPRQGLITAACVAI